VILILRCVVVEGEGSSRLGLLSRGPSPFLIGYTCDDKKGFGNLRFHLGFTLLGGSFVFLNVAPFILFLVFPSSFFFGCFGLLMIGRVSSLHASLCQMPCNFWKV